MTRKEYFWHAKIFGLSLLVTIPLLIALDLLIEQHISNFALITIDVVLILFGYVVALMLADKRKKHIAKKRQEFLAQKEQQPKQENEQKNQIFQQNNQKNKKKHKKHKH